MHLVQGLKEVVRGSMVKLSGNFKVEMMDCVLETKS